MNYIGYLLGLLILCTVAHSVVAVIGGGMVLFFGGKIILEEGKL